jgi:hypothetical protein
MTNPDAPSREEAAKKLADMAQRVSMRIAELPLERREDAFTAAELEMKAIAEQVGMPESREELVRLLMKGLRKMVLDLDVSGQPQGGKA